jgi:hypothetical protein
MELRPMTAIACAYTPEGFVIAADGLRVDPNTGRDVTTIAQKIFPVAHVDFHGAYAWAGATNLFSPDRAPFVVVDETVKAINELSEFTTRSATEYITRIGSGIYDRLVAYNRGARINSNLLTKDGELFRGIFVGYIDSRAWLIQIGFPVRCDALLPPVVDRVCESPHEFCVFSGSELVWNDVQSFMSEPSSTGEAANLVRGYIQACSAKRNAYGDCKNVGGHIHIAVVTPNGFHWDVPPIKPSDLGT